MVNVIDTPSSGNSVYSSGSSILVVNYTGITFPDGTTQTTSSVVTGVPSTIAYFQADGTITHANTIRYDTTSTHRIELGDTGIIRASGYSVSKSPSIYKPIVNVKGNIHNTYALSVRNPASIGGGLVVAAGGGSWPTLQLIGYNNDAPFANFTNFNGGKFTLGQVATGVSYTSFGNMYIGANVGNATDKTDAITAPLAVVGANSYNNYAMAIIQSGSFNAGGLQIRGGYQGTSNLLIQDYDGENVFAVKGNGKVLIGNDDITTQDAALRVHNNASNIPVAIFRMNASQSVNATEWQDSSSGVYAVITKDGEFSNAQGYTQSESFGDGAILGAAYSTVVGYGAKTSSTYSVAVGHSASGAGQQSVAIGYNARAPYLSVAVGEQAGASGSYSVAMGYQAAGKTPSTENYITAIGYQPLYGNAGYSPNLDYAVAIGYQAGYNLNAGNDYIVAIGNQALYAASGAGGSTVGSVAIGEKAGRNGDGYGLIALGGYAADNYSSVNLVAIGGYAASNIQNSNSIVCIGSSAGSQASGVFDSVLIGNNAGYRIGNPTYGGAGGNKKCVAIGSSAMSSYKGDPGGCVGIGPNALISVSGFNNIGIGNGVGQGVIGSNNLLIGNLTGYLKGLVSNTLAIGSNQNCPQGTGNTVVNGGYGGGAGCLYNTSVGLSTNLNATRNTGCVDIGYNCGTASRDSSYITSIGYSAGGGQTNSSDIINIGRSVGTNNNDNYDNINIGSLASQLCSSMSGVVVIAGGQSNYNSDNTKYNIIIGYTAAQYANDSLNNIWMGYQAGNGADNCRDTVAIGSGAGLMQNANDKYESCVFIGQRAGKNCNGSGNIEILTSGSPNTSVLDNHSSRLNIANTIRGHLTSGTISIGQNPTLNPSYTLSVEGSVSGNDYTFSDGTTQTTAADPAYLRPYVEITGSYTITSSGYGVFISASGNTTITMPSVALGRTVNIIRTDNEAYTVTATGAASELFNGNPSLSIAPSNSVDLVSNGTNWYIK